MDAISHFGAVPVVGVKSMGLNLSSLPSCAIAWNPHIGEH